LGCFYQVGYFLNENKNWGLDVNELERSITEARKHCNPRAIVVINPGNPTGLLLVLFITYYLIII